MRLIDAEKLCLHLADIQLANRGWKDDYCEVLDDIISIIDEQTTIEAEPVRHGKWIKFHDELSKCSLCNYPTYTRWNQTDYCPNCGAKMEGDS